MKKVLAAEDNNDNLGLITCTLLARAGNHSIESKEQP